MAKTIEKRIRSNKDLLIEKLKKTPVVQVACKKVGVGRATYYRWRKEDEKFARTADTALEEGSSLINDMAESQLLSAIRDQNMTAIIFWLKHHHRRYATRVELDAKLKIDKETLTTEQEVLVNKALKLAGLLTTGDKKGGKNDKN